MCKWFLHSNSNLLKIKVSRLKNYKVAVDFSKKITMFSTVILSLLVSLSIPSIASAMTKEDILNSIVPIQKSSTENQISSTLETLIQEKIATINSQLVVNVMDYGAKGNGVDSDVAALKSAVAYLNTKGGGSVFFPSKDQNNVPYNYGCCDLKECQFDWRTD